MTEPFDPCCQTCHDVYWDSHPGEPWWKRHGIFIVCSKCGNKRCPKATDHRLECTGSNEPGQPGSVFQNVPFKEG